MATHKHTVKPREGGEGMPYQLIQSCLFLMVFECQRRGLILTFTIGACFIIKCSKFTMSHLLFINDVL